MLLRLLSLILVSSWIPAHAGTSKDTCALPDWMQDPDVPACPTSGSQLVTEMAPALAVVVSRLNGWSKDPATGNPVLTKRPLQQFVIDALEAAGERTPKVILPGATAAEIEELKRQIDAHCVAGSKCSHLAGSWKASLVGIPGEDFQWQQDYFQPTVDPATGIPVIRPVRDYRNGVSGELVAGQIAQASSQSGVCASLGETIPPKTQANYDFGNFAMGGNIEALPGGLCLHGNNQPWESFGTHYCGDKSNSVELDVKWLSVGHVDEVVGLLPDPSGKSPCDFSISWASPKKALELMKDPANRDQPFLEFFKDPIFAEQLKTPAIRNLCNSVREYRKSQPAPSQSPSQPPSNSRGSKAGSAASLPSNWLGFFIPEAQAGEILNLKGSDGWGCGGLPPPTNGEVAAVLEKAGYNLLIQETMEGNRKILEEKIKARTGCTNIKFMPVPNLFFGGEPLDPRPDAKVVLDGKERLFGDLSDEERSRLPIKSRYAGITEKRALGLLPNPTNAVLMGKTLIGPKPWNEAFRKNLQSSYKSVGLEFREADTWEANTNQGNLHCSTNVIRACRGAK